MNTFNLSAAMCVVVLSTFATIAPAQAQNAPVSGARGRYEWQAAPQSGPRAAIRAPVRVWVPTAQNVADCDCAMMRAKAPDCMSSKAMPSTADASSDIHEGGWVGNRRLGPPEDAASFVCG